MGRLTRDGSTLVGTALILASVVFRWVTLRNGYYAQDDYLMFARSVRAPLSSDFLLQGFNGHVWPAGFLWAWLDSNLAQMNWELSLVPLVLCLATVAILAWVVLTQLLGTSWWRVPLLVVVILCPTPLWSTQWWCVAIQYLPVTIFLLTSIVCQLRWQESHPRRATVAIGMAMAAALMFQVRGLLIAPVVVLLSLACASGSLRERFRLVFRRDGATVLVMAAIGTAYLFAHRALVDPEAATSPAVSEQLRFATNVIFQNVLPGMWGGPWRTPVTMYGVLFPSFAVVLAAALATGGMMVMTIRRGGRDAAWGWLLVVVFIFLNTGLLLGGRSAFGSFLAFAPRYAADVVVPLVVALALVVRSVTSNRSSWRLPLAAALAYAISAGVTWSSVLPPLLHQSNRDYVTSARAAMKANPGVVLVDGPVPDQVMRSLFGYEATVSVVFAAAPERPQFNQPTRRLQVLDLFGHLTDVELVDIQEIAVGGGDCGHAVTSEPTTLSVDETGLHADRQVLRFSYFTSTATRLTVSWSGRSQSVAVGAGADWVDFPVEGPATGVQVKIANPTSTLCVTSAEIGRPRLPVPTGSPGLS